METMELMLIRPERRRSFERERLINLIESKVRRREIDTAKAFAEELFESEVTFALREKSKKFARYNDFILGVIVLAVAAVVVSVGLMILNIEPLFSLKMQALAVSSTLSFIAFDSLLVKRFDRFLKRIADFYETQKHDFVERVLSSVTNRMPLDLRIDLIG